ncbi:MAG TPA: hypothetical protein VEA40_22535, partial [Ramlibacter sp.]|nr:hypothetical protein [Ramlibacter sp.]
TRAWNAETGEHLDEEPTITGPHVHSVKYLDIRKAKERLGWEPRMSLDQGLRETIAWYRAHSHVCGLA